MGVKVKGIRQVSRNVNRAIDNIQDRRVVRALTSAMIIISAEAATMVPVDTSKLLNSGFRDIVFNGTRITGRVGYTANYAMYVHEAKGIHLGKHTLRPVRKGEKLGSRGYIWDRTGEPKFLEKAADNTVNQVDAVIKKEMSL